jgi:F420H(2)-dependent quinone reductase
MTEYIPSPREWVRNQVELYERSGGTEGTTLRDTGLPVIIVTHTGNKTGAIREAPFVAREGRRQLHPRRLDWRSAGKPGLVYNFRANPVVEIRDHTTVQPMWIREVADEAERARVWELAVSAYPPYAYYQARTTRRIPIFVAEPPV